jgi:hypothetical protein
VNPQFLSITGLLVYRLPNRSRVAFSRAGEDLKLVVLSLSIAGASSTSPSGGFAQNTEEPGDPQATIGSNTSRCLLIE